MKLTEEQMNRMGLNDEGSQKATQRPAQPKTQAPQANVSGDEDEQGLMVKSGNKALVRNQKKLDRARERGTSTAIAEVKQEFSAYAHTRLAAEDTLDQMMDDFDAQLDAARESLVPSLGKSPDFLEPKHRTFSFTLPSSSQSQQLPSSSTNGSSSESN